MSNPSTEVIRTREAARALVRRLRAKVPTGRFTIGGGNVSADGKAATWGGEPIFGLRNPDGPEAADLIEKLATPDQPAQAVDGGDGFALVPMEVARNFAREARRLGLAEANDAYSFADTGLSNRDIRLAAAALANSAHQGTGEASA